MGAKVVDIAQKTPEFASRAGAQFRKFATRVSKKPPTKITNLAEQTIDIGGGKTYQLDLRKLEQMIKVKVTAQSIKGANKVSARLLDKLIDGLVKALVRHSIELKKADELYQLGIKKSRGYPEYGKDFVAVIKTRQELANELRDAFIKDGLPEKQATSKADELASKAGALYDDDLRQIVFIKEMLEKPFILNNLDEIIAHELRHTIQSDLARAEWLTEADAILAARKPTGKASKIIPYFYRFYESIGRKIKRALTDRGLDAEKIWHQALLTDDAVYGGGVPGLRLNFFLKKKSPTNEEFFQLWKDLLDDLIPRQVKNYGGTGSGVPLNLLIQKELRLKIRQYEEDLGRIISQNPNDPAIVELQDYLTKRRFLLQAAQANLRELQAAIIENNRKIDDILKRL